MNRIQSVMRMHYRDKWSWIYIPLIILAFSFIVNILIGYLAPDGEGITSGGLMSVFIYTLVAGMVVPSQTFSFAIGLSVRRRDYFWGTAASILFYSALMAVMLTVLSFVESITNGWGVELGYFHLPYVHDGNIAVQFLVGLSLLLHMFTFGLLCAAYVRRFGRKGVYVMLIAMLLIGTIASYALTHFALWGSIGEWLVGHSALFYAAWMLLLTIVYGAVIYLFLRRAI